MATHAAIVSAALRLNDLDRRIWEEELEGLLPDGVFDAHVHLFTTIL